MKDDKVKINFMESTRANICKWPKRKDEIWVEKGGILCKITAPLPSGRSHSFCLLPEDTVEE